MTAQPATGLAGSSARRDLRLRTAGVAATAITTVVLALLPFGVNPAALSIVTLGLVHGLFTYGLDLSWGRVGLISVGQAAFFGIGAYAVAVAPGLGLSPLAAAAIGVALAALLAGLVARLALGIEGETAVPLFILLTLGVSQLLQRSASSFTEVTGGSNGLSVSAPPLLATYYLVLGVVVVVVAATFRFVVKGRVGAFQLAVTLQPRRAESLGISPRSTAAGGFMVAGAVSAVAGALFAPVAGIVTPHALGLALSTSVLTWLAVGGKGSLAGPFAGAMLLTLAAQFLGGAWQSLYVFALAVAFIVVIEVAPEGLAGAVRKTLRRGRDIPRLPRARPVRPRPVRGAGSGPLLEVTGVEYRIGRATILHDVSLAVERGRCVALIGPNGAGKSTLLSVIAGQLHPTRGTVTLGREGIDRLRPDQRARRGIGRMFQVPSVFADLSVADNRRIAGLMAGRQVNALTRHTAGREDEVVAGELSMAERRNLELDMVLEGPPDLVLLDEPAAGLSHADARELARRLRRISAESGCSMLIVEHDMEIVREVADVVVVLAAGTVIATGSMDEIVAHDAVREAYLGVGA